MGSGGGREVQEGGDKCIFMADSDFDEHEFEQAPGVGDGQGCLACCSPWGCKELDMTEQLNGTELNEIFAETSVKCSRMVEMHKMKSVE